MKEHWFDMIDISAGAVASGEAQPYSDQYGFHNDMCIFNPAPIT